jgi:hypothetical protein
MILKRILVVLAVILILVGIMAVRTLHLAGVFKTIKPHTGCERLVIGGMPGPEDITIHPGNGLAYISSDDRRARADVRELSVP